MTNRPNLMNLSGQTALITGGNKGIGYACANLLADSGADIIIISRTGVSDKKYKELTSYGKKVYSIECDLNNFNKYEKFLSDFPTPNILVNNAGTNLPMPINEVTEDVFDKIINLNLKSVYFLTRLIVKKLILQDLEGTIINISSQMGHVGDKNRTVYCSSKHAIEGFTKSLAIELAAKKIRVNSVSPTFIETEMTRPFFEDVEFKDSVLNRIPKGTLASVDDVSWAVLFLASKASNMITGTSIKVDGGWSAQ